ncbi:4435_t:CDS:2 [Cetraspora pellucida]|uniref:4435_t:CDS:1 n=1 Tax=Cetraspora pellucida TaxID=1433469 RepID=A0A9N9EB10_9GLOM|nr:4435_t:CDS:2 [Cetraspora pellucida]
MANIYTLRDFDKGHHFGSMQEQKLEKSLHHSLKSIYELNNCNKTLQSKYLKQVKAFNRERKNTEFQKLYTHISQIIDESKQLQNENTNLTSQLTQSQIFQTEYKAKYLKSENKSKLVVGRNNEKNMQSEEQSSIIKSDNISAISKLIKNLSKYFIYKKSIDQTEKINDNISDHIDYKNILISEESMIQSYIPISKVDVENSTKLSDDINISRTNNNVFQRISNMASYFV